MEAGIEPLESRIAPSVFLVTNLNDSGAGSLRAAIDGIGGSGGANDSAGSDTVVFAPGLAGTIHLSQAIPILDSLVVKGNGRVTLSGDNLTQILDAGGPSMLSFDVRLQKLTFANGKSVDDGGAIRSTENLTVIGCKFLNNVALSYGGAISQSGSDQAIILRNCQFLGNQGSASNSGGALDVAAGTASITHCVFRNNSTSAGSGGAIRLAAPHSLIANSIFTGNSAGGDGGSIYLGSGACDIANCQVTQSSAAGSGGAVSLADGTSLTLDFSVLKNNKAGSGGGAIQSGNSSTMKITESVLAHNSATNGGALAVYGDLSVSYTRINANSSASVGGGINVYAGNENLSFVATTFKGNHAEFAGGAAHLWNFGTETFTGCVIAKNTSKEGGGGLYVRDGTLVVSNSTIRDNAADQGGGVYLFESSSGLSTTYLIHCFVTGNTAITDGGGLSEHESTNPIVIDSVVLGNSAPTNPDFSGEFTV